MVWAEMYDCIPFVTFTLESSQSIYSHGWGGNLKTVFRLKLLSWKATILFIAMLGVESYDCISFETFTLESGHSTYSNDWS